MELPGQIVVSSPQWLPGMLGGFAVFLLVLAWTYRGTGMSMGRRLFCILLKAVAVALLLLCLLEPQLTRQKPEAGANYFAALADNSQSMSIFDPGLGRTRAEAVTGMLVTEPGCSEGPKVMIIFLSAWRLSSLVSGNSNHLFLFIVKWTGRDLPKISM